MSQNVDFLCHYFSCVKNDTGKKTQNAFDTKFLFFVSVLVSIGIKKTQNSGNQSILCREFRSVALRAQLCHSRALLAVRAALLINSNDLLLACLATDLLASLLSLTLRIMLALVAL